MSERNRRTPNTERERLAWEREDTLDPERRLLANTAIYPWLSVLAHLSSRAAARASWRARATRYRARHRERVRARGRVWAIEARRTRGAAINARRRVLPRDARNAARRAWSKRTGYMRDYMRRWRAQQLAQRASREVL